MSLSRDPSLWAGDVQWYVQINHGHPRFQWFPEGAVQEALKWTRGSLEWTSLADYVRLQGQQRALAEHVESTIDVYIGERLSWAQRHMPAKDFEESLPFIGLDQQAARTLRRGAGLAMTPLNASCKRVLDKIGIPNPLSQAWELLAVRSLQTAAQNLLEDAACDLLLELSQQYTWDRLWQADELAPEPRARVREQRRLRGGPDDTRRAPENQPPHWLHLSDPARG